MIGESTGAGIRYLCPAGFFADLAFVAAVRSPFGFSRFSGDTVSNL
jgi:hypothetical protein